MAKKHMNVTELSDVNKDLIPEKIVDKFTYHWNSSTDLKLKIAYLTKKFYFTRLFHPSPPTTFPFSVKKGYLVDPDDYWTDEGYVIPSGYYNWLATYSKTSLMYPFLGVYMKLPDLTNFPDGTTVWFGFEHGGNNKTGIAAFQYTKESGAERLKVQYGSKSPWMTVDVTPLLPSNYKTMAHNYYIKVNIWGAEFYIESNLVAVMLDGQHGSTQGEKVSAPPYSIGATNMPVIKRLHTLLEIAFPSPTFNNISPNPGSLRVDVTPDWFRWGEGTPNPPRAFRLYRSGSTSYISGSSILDDVLISHPFPLFGRKEKTLYFQTNKSGTLNIEVLTITDKWRTYDKIRVVANKLLVYNFEGAIRIARITFVPHAYPARIDEAEVILQ